MFIRKILIVSIFNLKNHCYGANKISAMNCSFPKIPTKDPAIHSSTLYQQIQQHKKEQEESGSFDEKNLIDIGHTFLLNIARWIGRSYCTKKVGDAQRKQRKHHRAQSADFLSFSPPNEESTKNALIRLAKTKMTGLYSPCLKNGDNIKKRLSFYEILRKNEACVLQERKTNRAFIERVAILELYK